MHCAGLRCVGQVEIVPFRRRVLARHFPDVPQWDDITTFDLIALGWEIPDVVLFGSPCQDLSIAGRRAGLEGARSGLFFEATRIIRSVRPTFVVWENVPGALTSSEGDDFAAIIDELADCGAMDIQWRVLDSRYWGVAQRRRRVFVVSDFAGYRSSKVLLESSCSARDSSAGRTPGTHVAASLTRGSGSRGNAGRRREDDSNLVPQVAGTLGSKKGSGWADDLDRSEAFIPVARSLNAPSSQRYDGESETFIVSPTMRSQQLNNSDGDTKAQMLPFVKTARAHSIDDAEQWADGDVSPTLNAFDSGESRAPTLVTHALTAEGHDASEDGTGRGTPIVAATLRQRMRGYGDEVVDSVQVPQTGVRRLTPVETERLQGLPDNWTAIDGNDTPDSPRYAGVGDAMTASVVQWIGERLLAVHADGLRATQ